MSRVLIDLTEQHLPEKKMLGAEAVVHGEQTRDLTLDPVDANNWISKLRLVKNCDDAKLETYRNHL